MPAFQSNPTWPSRGRGRVLIEAAEWLDRQTLEAAFSNQGFDASTCPGPSGADGRCPLAAGDGCQAADEADVVVHAMNPADLRDVEVIRSIRHSHPTTPVIVRVPEPTLARAPETYEGTTTVAPSTPNSTLVGIVAEAIEHRERRATPGDAR